MKTKRKPPVAGSLIKVIDPGHIYEMHSFDGEHRQRKQYLKRCDSKNPSKFPGNTSAHPGTTSQADIHTLIDRIDYVQKQKPHRNNLTIRERMVESLWLLEERAAELHGYVFPYPMEGFEKRPCCFTCGHVVCKHIGNARAVRRRKGKDL